MIRWGIIGTDPNMPLRAGTLIGPYEILAPLGAGGMGEVYRARDGKLGRDVALKVIPDAFALDADRMARFEREAKALASLNHPNIAAIYGIEQGAIVMELVDGEDLKCPVPIETAIHYARQIASGLEAAHEKGIIHRDLKPANIKVTAEGTVKILDFGLAKATEKTASGTSGASPTISPTLSLTMTKAGVILGTAAYMSPEQARGKPVDKRADIWAYGVVLYEMLTGRRTFACDDITETLAAVVMREPDWSALPVGTPANIRRLLEMCLRKDPKLRLRDIGDARIQIDEPIRLPERSRPILPWAIAAVMTVVAIAMSTTWLATKTREDGRTVRFLFTLPEGTSEPLGLEAPQVVPSPDGRHLAFSARDAKTSQQFLWVQPLNSTSAQRLDNTEGANFPFWSPDAQSIGFFADEKLKRIAITGGSPQIICEARPGKESVAENGGTWNRDGTILFNYTRRSGLMQVSARGGPARPATELDASREETLHAWPQFLPDGRHFLYFAGSTDASRRGVFVQEVGSSTRVLVAANTSRGAWVATGHLLFVRQNTLFAQRMDSKTFQLEGEPIVVTQDVGEDTGNGRSAFAVSDNGVLAYRGGTHRGPRQVTWYDREGKRLGTVGKPGEYLSLRLSPDEKSAAVTIGLPGHADTWIMDLSTGILTRMTQDSQDLNGFGAWSPDSRRMAISRADGETRELTVASGKTTIISKGSLAVGDWSPDGRWLLCSQLGRRLLLLPMTPGGADGAAKARTVLDTPSQKLHIRFSSDGQSVAYVSNEDEGNESDVYVASFPSFAEKRRVSLGGGYVPMWRADGKEIFYLAGNSTLMSAEIRTGSSIDVGGSRALFKTHVFGPWYGVTRDGKRFLVGEPQSGKAPQVTVVLNWLAELK
jgi:serine/threonine protein kinase